MNIAVEEVEKQKKNISEEEWLERLNSQKIFKNEMDRLIMNFFLIEGYKEAAENFKKESSSEISSCDLDLMSERIEIRSLIHKGEIDKAVAKVKEVSPQLFEQNKELYFNLQLQKLIEFIKNNQIEIALDFAQKELLPLLEKNENKNFMDSLEKVMSLLAFQDISKSPLADLAENSQRIKISSEVNYELLKSQSKEKESKLPTLIKMMLWAQGRLQEKMNFPVITNIATGELQFKGTASNIPNK